jgi:dTDP-4-amino-4,6-dideoxygalactose transaminase
MVLESGILTDSAFKGGKHVRDLESKCASLLNTRHVVAVNSGTAALQASLIAYNVAGGDEVVLPSFTFVSTANVVLACGAKPVFADIKQDYNIDPNDVKRKITKRTKAIVPVHLYGYPADLDEIKEIAADNSLVVIEDAAESLGAEYKDRQTGSIGDAGCFSFYATKVATSGEGGAVSTNNDEIAERLRMIRNHGMVEGYDTRVLGYNFRMPELLAAIASVQMDRLSSFIKARRNNASVLTETVSKLKGIRLTQNSQDRTHVWYLYTLYLAKNRDKIQAKLRSRGIGASVYWKVPVHKTPYYSKLGYAKTRLIRTSDAAAHVLSIPVHPGLAHSTIDFIANEIKEAAKEYL